MVGSSSLSRKYPASIPIINILRERYDDYVLDVEFVGQPETEKKQTTGIKTENTKITLRTAAAQFLTRVYSTDARRDRF